MASTYMRGTRGKPVPGTSALYVAHDKGTQVSGLLCDTIERVSVITDLTPEVVTRRLRDEQPTLVVLDLRVGGKTVRQIGEAMAAHASLRHIPRLLASTNADTALAHGAWFQGVFNPEDDTAAVALLRAMARAVVERPHDIRTGPTQRSA